MNRDMPMDDFKGDLELDTSILPIFQQYKQLNKSWLPSFHLWNYLNMRADLDMAAAFTKLFWPDFIEVDGCVLLKIAYSPNSFQSWVEHYHGDTRKVEAMINHVHISDLFLNPPKGCRLSRSAIRLSGKCTCVWLEASASVGIPG